MEIVGSNAYEKMRVGLEKAEGQQRKAYALRIAPRALTPRVKATSANPDQLGTDI